MQTATIDARAIAPITPDQVAAAATAELRASIVLLEDMHDDDWARPTDCAGWTVHDLTAHMVGQYQVLAKLGVFLRRHRRAHRRYPALSRLDADNRQQIDDLGGRRTLGQGAPVATVRADTVDYLRALSGRNDHPNLQVDGDHTTAAAVAAARVVF